MAVAITLLLGLAFAAISLSKVSLRATVLAAVIWMIPLGRFALWHSGSSMVLHSGIADASVTVYTYTIFFALAAGAVALSGSRTGVPPSLICAAAILPVMVYLGWGAAPSIVAGWLLILTAICAWVVGDFAGGGHCDLRDQRFISIVALVVVLLQVLSSLAELNGLVLLNQLRNSRTEGTFNHPTTVGKFLFLLLPILLPMTLSGFRRMRLIVWTTVLLAAVCVGLSQSRANSIAFMTAILLWLILAPNVLTLSSRFRLILIMPAVAAPFVPALLDRFGTDPTGGERPELLSAGLRQLSLSPWTGVGPNNYVNVVGQFDPATAAGYPAHNSLLLIAAELGIPLAILVLWPMITAIVAGISGVIGGRRMGNGYAAAIVATTPGLLIIGWTGWGLLNREMWPMMFFAYAFALRRIRDGDVERVERSDAIRNRSRPTRRRSAQIGSIG